MRRAGDSAPYRLLVVYLAVSSVAVLSLLLGHGLLAGDFDLPSTAPQDAVMASAAEVRELSEWVDVVFAGKRPPAREGGVSVECRRQDHCVLCFGQSCVETPLKIGARSFARGLGTHANSEIVLHPPPGAKTFKAFVGIDNNPDTGGVRGSVQFSVAVGGRELAHTPTLRGTNAAVPLEVSLPANTRELVLRVDTTPDGPSHDQADWAEAQVLLEDGHRLWADAERPAFLANSLPFSFVYGGERLAAHNRFRRLLLFEYVPRQNNRPLALPVALQCFDRYNWNRPVWGTVTGQLDAVQAAHQLGCDSFWLDAAWFEGGFPNGVGNWYCKPQGFPQGLKPVGEACHHRGLKFIVWFEPERVAPRTQIAREHPEFVLGGEQGGLFKLHEPAARAWLVDLISQRIQESGIDTYRNDFNLDPLDYWRRNDPPDRQGITEIRYDEARRVQRRLVAGRTLMSQFELRLPRRESSLLVRYRPE
jgi:hypothetical protein